MKLSNHIVKYPDNIDRDNLRGMIEELEKLFKICRNELITYAIDGDEFEPDLNYKDEKVFIYPTFKVSHTKYDSNGVGMVGYKNVGMKQYAVIKNLKNLELLTKADEMQKQMVPKPKKEDS